jgi:hypothetical protein
LEQNLTIHQTLTYVDYKENISVCMGPVQTQSSWFKKKSLTVFGILTIYRNEDGIKRKLIRTVISENLNHDSLFTDFCIEEVCQLYINYLHFFGNIIFC